MESPSKDPNGEGFIADQSGEKYHVTEHGSTLIPEDMHAAIASGSKAELPDRPLSFKEQDAAAAVGIKYAEGVPEGHKLVDNVDDAVRTGKRTESWDEYRMGQQIDNEVFNLPKATEDMSQRVNNEVFHDDLSKQVDEVFQPDEAERTDETEHGFAQGQVDKTRQKPIMDRLDWLPPEDTSAQPNEREPLMDRIDGLPDDESAQPAERPPIMDRIPDFQEPEVAQPQQERPLMDKLPWMHEDEPSANGEQSNQKKPEDNQ